MQNKRSRKAAREVNLSFNPRLKAERESVKKNGNRIPKRKRELTRIIECINTEISKDKSYKNLPANVSPVHFLMIKKMFEIGYRENKLEKEVKCPECGIKFDVELPHVKAEANSVSALKEIMDRTFPKLQHLSQDINLVGYMNVIVDYITQIVVVYVPQDKKPEALAKINEMFEKLMDREAGGLVASTIEDDESKLLTGIAG